MKQAIMLLTGGGVSQDSQFEGGLVGERVGGGGGGGWRVEVEGLWLR